MRKKRMKTQDQDLDALAQIQNDIKSKKQRVRKRKRNRFLKKTLFYTTILLLIGLLVWFDQSTYSRISLVRINGNTSVSDTVIKDALGIHSGDRIYTKFNRFLNNKGKKITGVKDLDAHVYKKDRIVSINVVEEKAVGYIEKPEIKLFYDNGQIRTFSDTDPSHFNAIPVFINFDEDTIKTQLIEPLGKIDEGIIAAISEIRSMPTEVEPDYMELVMNDNYRVYTTVKALPGLNGYDTIISGAIPGYHCVFLLEQGPTQSTQTLYLRPCE